MAMGAWNRATREAMQAKRAAWLSEHLELVTPGGLYGAHSNTAEKKALFGAMMAAGLYTKGGATCYTDLTPLIETARKLHAERTRPQLDGAVCRALLAEISRVAQAVGHPMAFLVLARPQAGKMALVTVDLEDADLLGTSQALVDRRVKHGVIEAHNMVTTFEDGGRRRV